MYTIFIYSQVIFYCSYAYLFLWGADLLPVKPLYWILLTILCGGVLIVFRHGLSLPPPKYQRILLWGIILLTFSTFSAVFVSGGVPEATQQLILYVEGVSILFIISILVQNEKVSRHAVYALLVVVITSVIINYLDFLGIAGIQISEVRGRAAGMYGNPNISGKFLVLGMAISVFVLPKKYRFIYCMFVLTGVVLTFSRASIIMWALVVVALTWLRVFVLPRAVSFTIMGGFVGLAGVMLVAGLWMSVFQSLGLEHYLDENTQSRISGSFIEQDDYSTMGRLAVAKKGIQTFLNSPLVGNGIGSGNNFYDGLRAHNSYIQLAAEQGIIGLGVFLSLIWIIWIASRDHGKVFIVGFAGFSLFTHNMLDQPAMYILFAMAITRLEYKKESGRLEKVENGTDMSLDRNLNSNKIDIRNNGRPSFPQPRLRK